MKTLENSEKWLKKKILKNRIKKIIDYNYQLHGFYKS